MKQKILKLIDDALLDLDEGVKSIAKGYQDEMGLLLMEEAFISTKELKEIRQAILNGQVEGLK